MGKDRIYSVTDSVREFCGKQIDKDLGDKIDRNQKADFGKRYSIGPVKGNK